MNVSPTNLHTFVVIIINAKIIKIEVANEIMKLDFILEKKRVRFINIYIDVLQIIMIIIIELRPTFFLWLIYYLITLDNT